jgi:hypothetical protein
VKWIKNEKTPQQYPRQSGILNKMIHRISFLVLSLLFLDACSLVTPVPTTPPDRESLIPGNQVKITPNMDLYPPKSLTKEYEDPVPLPYPVNTAGAEDSAFITPDGNTLYVWFTPDVSKPVEEQVTDGVTGIYMFHKTSGGWSPAERVRLQEAGKLALDGCEFVFGDKMWFCTVREGYTGIHWFTVEFRDGNWTNWENADFQPEYEVGELHITADGNELYYHSSRVGGKGGYDLWVSRKVNGAWDRPENLAALNSPRTDGWPFVTQDMSELWFTRGNGAPELYRSLKVNGTWSEPVQMFSHFCGESSMDNQGNVYFTHHFYKDDVMLEADIYVAYKK